MPDPTGSKQPNVRILLAEYLTNETTQFFTDIDWQYYSMEHDATMPPLGAIFIDMLDTDVDYPANQDPVWKVFKIHVILRITKETIPELQEAMENWSDYLSDQAIKKLQKEGYQDYFKGIHFRPRNSIIYEIDKNQDMGGRGILHLYLEWNDFGFVTSLPRGGFIAK